MNKSQYDEMMIKRQYLRDNAKDYYYPEYAQACKDIREMSTKIAKYERENDIRW